MVQLKPAETDSWIRRPPPDVAVVLIYGPDRGLVSERAQAYAKTVAADPNDPFAVVRLEAAEMEADPGRLFDEAATVPMFGSDRLVWITGAGAGKKLADAISRLCDDPPKAARILVEAGELRKGTPLRSTAEKSQKAVAIACYSDDARSIDRVIDDALASSGKTMTLDARMALRNIVGGDRLATRGEIEKLVLHAGDAREIALGDVEALAGDSAAISLDGAVDAALAGNARVLEETFARISRSGTRPFLVAQAALRQCHQLQLLRSEVDSGKSVAAAVASAKPPVFFARRTSVEKALSLWPQARLAAAQERLQGAILESRRMAALEEEIIRQAMLALSAEAAMRARQPAR